MYKFMVILLMFCAAFFAFGFGMDFARNEDRQLGAYGFLFFFICASVAIIVM